jgi:methyl-accepting chemotaxis protein
LRIEHGRVLRSGLGGAWDQLGALNISGRVNVLVGSMILVTLGIGLAGIVGMRSANQQVSAMYREAALATQYLDTIARSQYRSQADIATVLISQSPDKAQAAVNDIEKNIDIVSQTWITYLTIGHEENEKAVQQEFEALRAKYGAEGLKPALAALRKNDFVETQRIYKDIILPQFEQLSRNVDAQLAAQDVNSKQAMQASDSNYQVLRASTLAAMLCGMTLALFMGWRLRLSTVAPLNEAVAISKQIAVGALNNSIVPKGSDESGQLMAALFAMQRSLSSLAHGVMNSAYYIDMGALQIARGNESLAARTEEQATAVQEAASNMEEVSTTVQQNMDNAKAANQLVQEAGDIASRAGAAMSQVVGTMDSIAGSSRKITDIIQVIDGIAFQTNILALNAAVEAARAGEQGRGFAVVASEVRSLAKRSADAAKEIKALIEGSVHQVEGGLVQVSGARETLEATISAVKHVGTLMAEILHSSDEQGAAIQRVAQLVVQIDEATQQNVPIAENAASASRSLAAHGQALERSAMVFRLG